MRNKHFNKTIFLFVTVLSFAFIPIGCKHSTGPSKITSGNTESGGTGDTTSGENPGLKTAVYTVKKGELEITDSGILPEEAIKKALSESTSLTIKGPLIPENYEILKGQGITDLDLSGVTGLSQGRVSVSINEDGLLDCNNLIPLDFYMDTDIKTIILPDTANALPECAFTGCSSFVSVTGDSIEVIGYGAFYGTALQKAEFPKAREIGYNAFGGCKSLNTLKIPTAENLGDDLLYQSGDGSLSITLPGNLKIPDKPDSVNGEYPKHVFRGINTETVTLILSGNPENLPADKKWKDYTWKEIQILE